MAFGANIVTDSRYVKYSKYNVGILFLFGNGIWNGTNLAVLKDFSPFVAVIDTVWGFALGIMIGILIDHFSLYDN